MGDVILGILVLGWLAPKMMADIAVRIEYHMIASRKKLHDALHAKEVRRRAKNIRRIRNTKFKDV
jgi:hypothetical protein